MNNVEYNNNFTKVIFYTVISSSSYDGGAVATCIMGALSGDLDLTIVFRVLNFGDAFCRITMNNAMGPHISAISLISDNMFAIHPNNSPNKFNQVDQMSLLQHC